MTDHTPTADRTSAGSSRRPGGDRDDAERETVTMAHGAGGARMRALIDRLVGGRFDDPIEGGVGLDARDDGAVLPLPGDSSLVFTTDSHVVSPLRFPGGDIGRLAVAGTVNDLAVMGGTTPLGLSSAIVIEEGSDLALAESVVESMRATCEEAGCPVVTGDTKVMGAGEIDTLVVNTTGVALVPTGEHVSDAGLSPGDKLIVSGTVGDHGISLLAAREGFEFEGGLESDVAPLNGLVAAAMAAGRITAMKDPTRGGLAGALNEMAEKSEVGIEIREADVPVAEAVTAAGSVLGIDPMNVANEGVVVFGVDPADADAVLDALHEHPLGGSAAIVGEVTEDNEGAVVLDTGLGRRYLREPTGAQLPRIC